MIIDISKLDKAEVLMALYDCAKAQGMGFIHYTPEPMTKEEATRILEEKGKFDFDYLKGRVMKVWELDGKIDTRLYDRDNGEGQAYSALKHLLPKEKTE